MLATLILAHDVSDAAIAKRMRMLRLGGAAVTIAGFRRTAAPVGTIDAVPVVDFGTTKNGGFAQRVLMVLWTLLRLRAHRTLFDAADVIIARNLEMLAIAVVGARKSPRKPTIIYECLDIHRLMLGEGAISRIMRGLERLLLRHARAIFTSSPAFITGYFKGRNPTTLPIRLIENKILSDQPSPAIAARPVAPPWIIGWFGILRCRKSLMILAEAVRQSNGALQVIMRGRPALDVIPDFHAIINATSGLHFGGAYQNPDDLAALYNGVHFSWAIDFYEEGLNSTWLLPNRLYEGGVYGTVPMALCNVETGRALQKLGIGVVLDNNLPESLCAFLSTLTAESYQSLATAAAAVPIERWVYTTADCQNLIHFIEALHKSHRHA